MVGRGEKRVRVASVGGMKAIVLYHPLSDHAGMVADYAKEFKRIKNKELELISLETIEGAQMAKLYDITVYPAVLTTRESGQLNHLWEGGTLPLMTEIEAYLR